MDLFNILKKIWRPVLAATLIIILWINFIIAPLLGATIVPLPDQFWILFTTFAGVYGAGRSFEKTKNKEE